MLFSGGCRFSAGQCTSNQHLSKKDASFLLSLKPQLLIHLGKKWGHFTAFPSELDVRVCISSPKSGLTLPAFFCLGSAVVERRLSCSVTCWIPLNQAWNLRFLHQQAESLPLSYQESLTRMVRPKIFLSVPTCF